MANLYIYVLLGYATLLNKVKTCCQCSTKAMNMNFISSRILSEHFSLVYLLHFFSLCAAASSWRRICCHSSCATCSRDVGGTSVSSCSRLLTSSLKTSATKHLSVRNLYICHCCTMTKRQNTQMRKKRTFFIGQYKSASDPLHPL